MAGMNSMMKPNRKMPKMKTKEPANMANVAATDWALKAGLAPVTSMMMDPVNVLKTATGPMVILREVKRRG